MFKKLALLLVTGSLVTLQLQSQKRKVTVMDFDYGTIKTSIQSIYGTDADIGKGISDMLVNQLLQTGDYRLIERSALEKIMKEQNFSNSDRADPATAAKIGGLLGVDTMIVGSITTFGNEDNHYGGSGGGGTWYGKGLGGGLGINKNKTIVELTARLVDVNTGEILASVSGHGESEKKGLSVGGAGSSYWGKGGGGKFDMGSSNFQESQIGKTVKLAVAQLATNLDAKAPTLPPPAAAPVAALPPLDGLVADASSADIIINVGSKNGVKVGDTLIVTRVSRTINDPATGKKLRDIEDKVGTINVTSVDADSAIGRFTGPAAPKVGDHIKRPTP